jgi:hypothetical protein
MRISLSLLAVFVALVHAWAVAQSPVPSASDLPAPIYVRTYPNQPVDVTIVAGDNALGNAALPIALDVRNSSSQVITHAFLVIVFPDVTDRGNPYGFGIGFDDANGARNVIVREPLKPGETARVPVRENGYEDLAKYLEAHGQPLTSVQHAIVMAQVVKMADGTTFLPGGYSPDTTHH